MKETISNQKSPKRLKFGNLVFAGLLGTIAFNAVMHADIVITGVPLDIVAVLGNLVVGESEYSQTVGQAIHLANGVGLSLFFGYVVLPLSRRIAKQPLVVYAVLFAAFETVLGVWFGMLPALGAGIAGLEIDPLVPIITLIRHVVYGLVLGMILTLRKMV